MPQNPEMLGPSALAGVKDRIARAAISVGRLAEDVTLVAVSKQQHWQTIAPILAEGQRVFGENRVQEALERWDRHRESVEVRLIGPLQGNKARDAVRFFDVIETLDRETLAKTLADEIQRLAKAPTLYVQVNTGEEPQKAGVYPSQADQFISTCRNSYGLTVEGLMCIPPHSQPAGPHFSLLAKIAERNGLSELSMGMSDDFETAVRFGATSVRVGSAIFGSRF